LVYAVAQNLGNLDDTGTTFRVSSSDESQNAQNPNIPTASDKPPTLPRAALPQIENPLLKNADKRKISQGLRYLSRVGRSAISQMDEDQLNEILAFAKQLKRIAKDIEDTVKGS
jgi:hypothetical protein